MKALLNHPILSAVLALLIAVGTVMKFPDWAEGFYKQSYSGVPGITFTLLGFLVAAVTILLTIRDKPFLQALQRTRPELWKQLINEFFWTTYLTATFGLLVAVFGWQFIGLEASVWKKTFLLLYIFLYVLSAIQLSKTIFILHSVARN